MLRADDGFCEDGRSLPAKWRRSKTARDHPYRAATPSTVEMVLHRESGFSAPAGGVILPWIGRMGRSSGKYRLKKGVIMVDRTLSMRAALFCSFFAITAIANAAEQSNQHVAEIVENINRILPEIYDIVNDVIHPDGTSDNTKFYQYIEDSKLTVIKLKFLPLSDVSGERCGSAGVRRGGKFTPRTIKGWLFVPNDGYKFNISGNTTEEGVFGRCSRDNFLLSGDIEGQITIDTSKTYFESKVDDRKFGALILSSSPSTSSTLPFAFSEVSREDVVKSILSTNGQDINCPSPFALSLNTGNQGSALLRRMRDDDKKWKKIAESLMEIINAALTESDGTVEKVLMPKAYNDFSSHQMFMSPNLIKCKYLSADDIELVKKIAIKSLEAVTNKVIGDRKIAKTSARVAEIDEEARKYWLYARGLFSIEGSDKYAERLNNIRKSLGELAYLDAAYNELVRKISNDIGIPKGTETMCMAGFMVDNNRPVLFPEFVAAISQIDYVNKVTVSSPGIFSDTYIIRIERSAKKKDDIREIRLKTVYVEEGSGRLFDKASGNGFKKCLIVTGVNVLFELGGWLGDKEKEITYNDVDGVKFSYMAMTLGNRSKIRERAKTYPIDPLPFKVPE